MQTEWMRLCKKDPRVATETAKVETELVDGDLYFILSVKSLITGRLITNALAY